MIPANKIKYCLRRDIDDAKWNRCIEEADNGLIYACTIYLDIMAGTWDALILNDYEAVMPLPWNRKYGFCYLYQPYFIHSLGVFGLEGKSVTALDFLTAIPKKFKYWHMKLNESNTLHQFKNGFDITISTSTNHLLNLNSPYKEISAGYKRLCSRMIKKAVDNNIQIINGTPEDVINFYKNNYAGRHQKISSLIYNRLIAAATIFYNKGQAITYVAKSSDGVVTAAYMVLVDNKFIYSLIGGSSEKGKVTGSFYLLTNEAIKDHAATRRVFRFEGSDIPGIAFFDAQFNATPVTYPQLIKNALPFPINLLKG